MSAKSKHVHFLSVQLKTNPVFPTSNIIFNMNVLNKLAFPENIILYLTRISPLILYFTNYRSNR